MWGPGTTGDIRGGSGIAATTVAVGIMTVGMDAKAEVGQDIAISETGAVTMAVAPRMVTAVADSVVGKHSAAVVTPTVVAERSTVEAAMVAGSTGDAADASFPSERSAAKPADRFSLLPVLYPPLVFLLECRSLRRRGSKMNDRTLRRLTPLWPT